MKAVYNGFEVEGDVGEIRELLSLKFIPNFPVLKELIEDPPDLCSPPELPLKKRKYVKSGKYKKKGGK
jgi:hypothetical protein